MNSKKLINLKINTNLIDLTILIILLTCILFISFSTSIGNLTHDSVDYYTILQKIVSPNSQGIVDNPFFVEQRAPGYSIISIPSYYLLNIIGFFVKLNSAPLINSLIDSPKLDGFIPSDLLLAKDVFFNNSLSSNPFIFDWRITGALLLTSFIFLIIGIIFCAKTMLLQKEKTKITGLFLIGAIILLTPAFMQSVIQFPTYATLCAFGIISLFCYMFVKSYNEKNNTLAILAGVLIAILSLTRLEGIIIGLLIYGTLFFYKEKELAKNIFIGMLAIIPLFIIYTTLMFGKLFDLTFLKGDLNKILFDPNFIFQALFSLSSGALFFSPIILIGILGLFLNNKKMLKIIGIASILFMILICFRVPLICTCQLGENILIGNEIVICSINACTQLIQSDINRYLLLLVPFSLLGLQNLFFIIQDKFSKKASKK